MHRYRYQYRVSGRYFIKIKYSDLLIAATLVNESISTVLFLTRAAAEPHQFKQSRSEIVKAIEHPVNFQNKSTLPIEHGHK